MSSARPLVLPLLLLLSLPCAAGALLQDQPVRQKANGNAPNSPRVEMANVLFRYSPQLSIHVIRLRGQLLPTDGRSVPSFNDAASFVLATDAAEIRLTTAQLSGLMNSWLLSSPKAQLKNIQIGAEGDHLLIQGTMKKGVPVPFRAEGRPAISGDNRIRITIQHIKAAHLPVKGLMDALGMSMDDLVGQKGLKGMSVEGDSFLIDPQTAFPPPQIRARISSVQVAQGELVLTFGQGAPKTSHPPAKNYIYLRGGSIKYGREEMSDADLLMIDSTPADPFDFYLNKYWCQMVAGHIRVTPDQALRIDVPDFAKLRPGSCPP